MKPALRIVCLSAILACFFGLTDTAEVNAAEVCCCMTVFFSDPPTETCYLEHWRVGYQPDEVCSNAGGHVRPGPTSDCPVTMTEPTDTNQSKIYFVPNVPIPGTFEGRQLVDGTFLARYLRSFYVYFIWVVGILATVMVIYAGIQWITAAGNTSRIENAKTTMNGALIGLVLALTSVLILRAVNPTLVRFDSLSIFTVPTMLLEENLEKGEKSHPLISYNEDVSKIPNVTKWDSLITQIAAEPSINLDRNYVKAMMLVESGGNPNAESGDGACGLLQLMPFHTDDKCLKGEASAEANLRAGMRYIRQLMDYTCPHRATYESSGRTAVCTPANTNCTKGSWHYVIAGYNGGLGANCSSKDCSAERLTWWECEVNKDFDEVRHYVPKVEAMLLRVQQWGWGA